MSRVFIIDDDAALCRSLELQLAADGHEAGWAPSAAEGLAALSQYRPDLVLLDLKLPDANGLDVLRLLRERHRDVPVVMITGQQDMTATIDAMRAGAFDYLRKPFDLDDLFLMLEKVGQARKVGQAASLPSSVSSDEFPARPNEIVGADRKIIEVVKQIGLLSQSRITVLIEGESGTGKELVARALHEASTPDTPFVAVNCSAIVATLPESEFFGHEKGAFTGATERKIGKLEYAGQGTLFLDEIGDMSLELQAKMLRVIEQREFERVGGLESRPFRARVIAASNKDLAAQVKKGEFRNDLYYRLAVSRILIPPLRERRGDIPLLVGYFLSRLASDAVGAGGATRPRVTAIEETALQRLQAYDWPGNVRELQNVLSRAVALARGPVLTSEDLDLSLGAAPLRSSPTGEAPLHNSPLGAAPLRSSPTGREGRDTPDVSEIATLKQAEKAHIERALAATGWNLTQTARILEISPTTLRKKIADYGLQGPKIS